ncbi:MAG: uracil-DNA glycosylase [Candidatus Brocadiaceae bacterium]|nr:uracil-DNA glycosylase [Candidatus Brocadiaceae bacterium]
MSASGLRKRLETERMLGVDALMRRPGPEAELRAVEHQVTACARCPLHRERTRTVFARGSARARLMFIGEAPGAEEDRQGVPFVGAAGQLLDRMIAAMGMDRDEVYVSNILKCRPPGNRDPQADEVRACVPYLERQIALVRPEVICTLGLPAARALLHSELSIGALRGRWHSYKGIPLMPTYHPAYLLRSPGQKRRSWEDLKMVQAALRGRPPS